ncbi:MAG: hypothetical protein WC556_06610 [Candidatus Methanoperedens sp.]
MEIVALIGLVIGLLGAIAGIGAMIYALGHFEYLGGNKKNNILPISKEKLKQKLLALNSQDLPYVIKSDPETDLFVEWKIVDAAWYAIFAKERLSMAYRAYLVLDETRKAVRYCEETGTVRWMVGTGGSLNPVATFQKSYFRGRILFQKSWEVQYGIKEDGTLGKVYEYKFDVNRVRDPIVKVIEESGWEFVPVVRKEHATYKSMRK